MSLSRSNCTLLGRGASAPPVDAGIVLGGADSVCYLGGSAPGATMSAAALSLKAGAQLVTTAGAGAVGAPLLSGGAAGSPTWSATSPLYVYSANSNLAAGTSGERAFLKNSSSASITVTGTSTGFVVGTAAAVSTTTLAGGASAMLVSDGTNWLQTYQSGPPLPTVTSVSPASGPLAGGTVLTITGTAFTGATAVSVGGVAATSVTVVNDTTITATTPAGSAGTASVNVTTPGGTSANNSFYSYAQVPAVTNVSPVSGPLAGGTVLTITGTAFTGATAVSVGGVAATSVTVVNDTSITAMAPVRLTTGAVSVLVTTPGGTSANNTLYSYTAAVPTVTFVSPVSGPLAGGTTITISGTAFTGATAVSVGGSAATSFNVFGDVAILAITPAGSAGAASVQVITPGGTSVNNSLYTYLL
jgi:hypothetical protein